MFVDAWVASAGLTLVLMTVLWLLSLRLRDSSIVDIFWGAGFAVIAAFTAWRVGPAPLPWTAWVMVGLVSVWGLRLALHIYVRNRGKGEDYRYRAWRTQAGPAWWWRSYVKVFLLQGFIMWLVATPVVATVTREPVAGADWLAWAGVVTWLVGFVFETAGDWQLTQFRADPANRGRVLDSGVWRYTRHPNYFGDAAVWWGHFLLAAATGAWWAVFSPVLMTFLLVRVSGVALLETGLRASKPGYADYVARTSAFFPRPPRRG